MKMLFSSNAEIFLYQSYWGCNLTFYTPLVILLSYMEYFLCFQFQQDWLNPRQFVLLIISPLLLFKILFLYFKKSQPCSGTSSWSWKSLWYTLSAHTAFSDDKLQLPTYYMLWKSVLLQLKSLTVFFPHLTISFGILFLFSFPLSLTIVLWRQVYIFLWGIPSFSYSRLKDEN